jgi:hypothetical protein
VPIQALPPRYRSRKSSVTHRMKMASPAVIKHRPAKTVVQVRQGCLALPWQKQMPIVSHGRTRMTTQGQYRIAHKTSSIPDWSTFYAEPQLDDNVNGESLASVGPQWSPLFYYVHVAGSALRPRDSSVEWGTSGSGGCLYNVSGSTSVIFNVHLDIPDGSRIDYLRIYYYDDDTTNNSRAWVTSYDDEGGLTDVVTVASDGDTGYGTMLSAEIAHVVDMLNNSYVLNWRPYASGNMALCGLRVAYRLPD